MTNYARFENYSMTLPSKGPVSIPDTINFAANVEQEIDLSQVIANGWMEYISGAYIDNTANTSILYIRCEGTNQVVPFPAGKAGYVPLLAPNPPKFYITTADTVQVKFQWLNIPVFPMLFGADSGGGALTDVNITQIDGNAITGPNLPVEIIAPSPIPISPAPVTITDYSDALTGANQTIVAAGDAENYLLIQNPTGNGPVTINIAGGDASASGFELLAGGTYENTRGITNAIQVDGTAAETLIVFAG